MSDATTSATNETIDERFIRHSIRLAWEARRRGDHPFGALLVSADGEVMAEAMNTVGTTGDRTGHAERNLMSAVSPRYTVADLASATMYTSTEPCAMCAASVFWTGVGRVVFGFGEAALGALAADDPTSPMLALPCRDVLACGSRATEVIGPVLHDEAAEPHRGFWGESAV